MVWGDRILHLRSDSCLQKTEKRNFFPIRLWLSYMHQNIRENSWQGISFYWGNRIVCFILWIFRLLLHFWEWCKLELRLWLHLSCWQTLKRVELFCTWIRVWKDRKFKNNHSREVHLTVILLLFNVISDIGYWPMICMLIALISMWLLWIATINDCPISFTQIYQFFFI